MLRESIAGMEALRDGLGDEVEICFDIHARLDPSDAIQLSRGIEHTRPYFIEDPIRSENVQLYRHLRQHVHSPIAAGEHYASKWEMRQLIEEDLIDFARTDLCIVGGMTEAQQGRQLVRDAPDPAGDPQPARAGLGRGLPAPQRGRDQPGRRRACPAGPARR